MSPNPTPIFFDGNGESVTFILSHLGAELLANCRHEKIV